MSITSWGNFIIWLMMFVDTFAVYFLIVKAKALEAHEEQNARTIQLQKEQLSDFEETQAKNVESIGNLRKKLTAQEKKLKAILDEE